MSVGDLTELAVLAILLREGRMGDPAPDYPDQALWRAVGKVGARLAWDRRPLPRRAPR